MITLFSDFTDLCERLRSTTKRTQKVAYLSEFLKSLNAKERTPAALFILGKPFPGHDPRTLDVSWRTVQRVSEKVTGKKSAPEPLTILELETIFSKIAMTTGTGSRRQIEELLLTLFNRASEIERKYLVKIIFGEMQTGVAEGVLLEGIAKASAVQVELVRRANMYVGNPGEVAAIALGHGVEGLQKIQLRLFRPVQPMLAELAEEFATIVQEHGGRTAFEFKFDGARVQIHKNKDQIRIFSRHLSDVTESLPDLVNIVRDKVYAQSVIVEGEVVAVGGEDRPLPFQELMRRFRRVHDIQTMIKEVPIKLYLFDLLYLNGKSQIETPYEKRWELLEQVCQAELLVKRLITDNEGAAAKFLQRSLQMGHEGLMAKKLDSYYSPGSRGKKWFKIKPAETLDLVIVAADWGSGRRIGWLSNYHLSVRDEATGEFLMVGKTFKGLTDQEFKWMTEKLQSLKVKETPYTVYVRPELVVEVAYNEIQHSPHYKSKFALRFARIKRIREDKSPNQADTLERIGKLYEKQFERKARASEMAKFK